MIPRRSLLLFFLPWLVSFAVFSAYPIGFSLGLSFADYNPFGGGITRWVGLENYRAIFADSLFWRSFTNTIVFVVGTVLPTAGISLILAVLINRSGRLLGCLRGGYFIPSVVSLAAVSLIFKYIYSKQGFLNAIVTMMGGTARDWLLSPKLALPSIIAMDIWASIGYYAIFYLAGLQTIPQELYEAARMDGAGRLAIFRFITLPSLKPVIVFVVVVNTIRAFQVFVEVVIMTRGGPMGSTMTLIYYMYEKAFHRINMGAASAVAVVVFALIAGFALLQVRLLRQVRSAV